jgi:hypothetical protein
MTSRWMERLGWCGCLLPAVLLAGLVGMHGLSVGHGVAMPMSSGVPAGHATGGGPAKVADMEASTGEPATDVDLATAADDESSHDTGDLCLAVLTSGLLLLAGSAARRLRSAHSRGSRHVAHRVLLSRVSRDPPAVPCPSLDRLCIART